MNVTSKIELNEDGFGTFNPEVIAMLLNSIRDFFASVGVESMKPIVIVHDPTGPECCAIPNEEKHLIKLSTGGDFWCQWVYQFAHEYCHHLIDGGLVRQTAGLRWLEESICHVASYVCLDNFARICAQRVDLCGNVKQIVDYDNQGGYMVVDNRTGFAVGGARYDWSLDDVQGFADGDLPYD